MPVQVGDLVPSTTLQRLHDGDIERLPSRAWFANGKVLLFAVPGAFTPACSQRHLPGYVAHMDDFRARGIRVACLAVNDAYVMHAWGQVHQVPVDLAMLSDGNAEFVSALDLVMDGCEYGMGLRAKRFALYAVDGRIAQLAVEAPGEYRVTGAAAMLKAIDALHG